MHRQRAHVAFRRRLTTLRAVSTLSKMISKSSVTDEADEGSLGCSARRDGCLNRQGLAAHELQDAGARHYSPWDLGFGVWDLGLVSRFLSSEAYASAAARDPRIHPMTIPINNMPGM